MQGRARQPRTGNMHTVSAGAREPRAMLLRQGPEATGPAPERQKDMWIDTKAEKSWIGMSRQLQGRKEAAGGNGWE